MHTRITSRWAGLLAGLTLLTVSSTAYADSVDEKPRPNVTITAPGPKGAVNDVVTCALSVAKPIYSGGVMTAVGGFKSCTPHQPFDCNSEIDIEWYAPGPGRWLTVAAANRRYGCPPPSDTGRPTAPATTTAPTPCTPTAPRPSEPSSTARHQAPPPPARQPWPATSEHLSPPSSSTLEGGTIGIMTPQPLWQTALTTATAVIAAHDQIPGLRDDRRRAFATWGIAEETGEGSVRTLLALALHSLASTPKQVVTPPHGRSSGQPPSQQRPREWMNGPSTTSSPALRPPDSPTTSSTSPT